MVLREPRGEPRGEGGWGRLPSLLLRPLRWAEEHPILAITLFSPVIPELLSGSTPLSLIYVSPVAFGGLLVLEMALYGSGILLVREATLRWKRGWTCALLLAAAFAVFEEGFTTILLPHSVLLADPTLYGRWMGVNWIWAAVILQLHTSFSIGSQVLLFHLAFPRWRARPLLSNAGIVRCCCLILGAYAAFLVLLGWVPPFPLAWVPLGTILGLISLARWLPRAVTVPWKAAWGWGPRRALLVGAGYPICLVIPEGFSIAWHLPAAVGVLAIVAVGGVFLLLFSSLVASQNNAHVLAGWLWGMLLIDLLWGGLTDPAGFPLALPLGVPVLYFLWRTRLGGAGPVRWDPVDGPTPIGSTGREPGLFLERADAVADPRSLLELEPVRGEAHLLLEVGEQQR